MKFGSVWLSNNLYLSNDDLKRLWINASKSSRFDYTVYVCLTKLYLNTNKLFCFFNLQMAFNVSLTSESESESRFWFQAKLLRHKTFLAVWCQPDWVCVCVTSWDKAKRNLLLMLYDCAFPFLDFSVAVFFLSSHSWPWLSWECCCTACILVLAKSLSSLVFLHVSLKRLTTLNLDMCKSWKWVGLLKPILCHIYFPSSHCQPFSKQ